MYYAKSAVYFDSGRKKPNSVMLYKCIHCLDRFYVGQNIAYKGTTGTADRKETLKSMFDGWFKEYQGMSPQYVQSYPESTKSVKTKCYPTMFFCRGY